MFLHLCKSVIPLLILCLCETLAQIDVETPSGNLTGVLTRGDTVVQFLGVPYAEPPTGSNRFQPPVPLTPWNGTWDATNYGAACLQNRTDLINLFETTASNNEIMFPPIFPIDENCLFLNIYVPFRENNTELIPVMLFLHGGDFVSGTGALYKGDNLAALNDVIVVTINYRLGALGFLTDGSANLQGNYGLHDQRMALQWVRDNIQSFGGDRERITLFGEGSSVHLHVLSPESNPLFNNAIIQSAMYNDGLWTQERAVDQYNEFIASFPENTSLDNLTSMEILIASHRMDVWNPHNDPGNLFPHDVMMQDNFTTNVDVMTGWNDASGTMATIDFTSPTWFNDLTGYVIETAFPELYGQITSDVIERMSRAYQQFYGSHVVALEDMTNFEQDDIVTSLTTDQFFATWSTEIASATRDRCDVCSVFQYRFTQTSRGFNGVQGTGLGEELPFIFGYATNTELSTTMMTYWSNFAKYGNPNNPANVTTQWPVYDATTSNNCSLRRNLGTTENLTSPDDVTTRSFEFWNFYYNMLGFSCENESATSNNGDDVTADDVCEPSVGETIGVPLSNELAGILLIVFIVLTAVFLVAFIIAIVCYCKTKKKLKKEKKKNKDEGHDNPVANQYKL